MGMSIGVSMIGEGEPACLLFSHCVTEELKVTCFYLF